MIQYNVSYTKANRHHLEFKATFPCQNSNVLKLQLPSWRPGRYELGNFSKNILSWKAYSPNGEVLSYKKITKDLWEVDAKGYPFVHIEYTYYSADLNAGSTYLSDELFYINPVNCFFYDPEHQDRKYTVQLIIPNDYKVATGLLALGGNKFQASSFDDLADCPILASSTLKKFTYECRGVKFHICIHAKTHAPEANMIEDFLKFTEEHFKLFGDIPCDEYHFLFVFPPYFIRHGVEHHNSTVICMGPDTEFVSGSGYKDLLAISCHELFHTWNIKNIRPIEMMPYDFSKENYSELGYVAEGVTTYYGDNLLYRTGQFSEADWMEELQKMVQEHFWNDGRFNLSVAQSSLETWLDGYGAGIPWRKVSIYNEGSLLTFISDSIIKRATSNKRSMDDVMKLMYERFGKMGIGYSAQDFQNILEEVSGVSFQKVFDQLYRGTADYTPYIIEALDYNGYQLMEGPSTKSSEADFGMVLDESGNRPSISMLSKNSAADEAGLWYGDEIVTIDGIQPYKNVQSILRAIEKSAEITFLRKNELMKTTLMKTGKTYLKRYFVDKKSSITSNTEG